MIGSPDEIAEKLLDIVMLWVVFQDLPFKWTMLSLHIINYLNYRTNRKN